MNGTRQPNISAVAWKEEFLLRQLYNPFIAAKNDWDVTPTKIGFAMNTSAPQMIMRDYSTADGYRGKTFVDNTKPDIAYINWYYLGGENDTLRRSTIGHEIGHALGLAHTANVALMNDARNRATIYKPQTEDISGIKAIYP